MEQFFSRFAGKHLVKRTIVMLAAVIVMGAGVGFFMQAAMGADPFSTLNLGVSSKIGLSFGTWQAIVNIALLILVAVLDRSKLGLGTIGNMFLVGYSADIVSYLLSGVMDASQLGLAARVGLTLLGVSMQLVGIALYVTCDLGMAPYDAISYIMPDRIRIPFRWWRIITDVSIVAIGFFCGASFGIGTLLMAFGTGPLVPMLNRYVAEPLLRAREYRNVP